MTAPSRQSASLDDARRMLALLARPGDVFELRALARVQGQQHTTSGFFDDLEALARAAVQRSGHDTGVYITLNPVHPGCLLRRPKNRVDRAGSGDTTSDKDIRTRRSILIDVDPTRPAGISSSDEEHEESLALTRTIRDALTAAGWPEPIFADSGNGGHLIYAVDLPVKDGGLVQRVLARLSKTYSTGDDQAGIKVDERVYNPARISKIYGTLTKKGMDSPERPHRIARILEAPDALAVVTREQLETFAPASTAPGSGTSFAGGPTIGTFDLDAWIATYLPDAKEQPWASGRRWILPVCPFNPQHAHGEAAVFQLGRGGVSAKCQHDSCRWGWKELRELYEPEATRRQGNASAGSSRTYDRELPHEVLYEDSARLDAIREAEELERFAARDREDDGNRANGHVNGHSAEAPRPPAWKRGPELVDCIWVHKDEPWIGLQVGADEIVRVRPGGIAVVMGPPGGGKSSLVSNMLIHHAMHVGPAIALSIELPADELAARIVGISCDASWEDALRGNVKREWMEQALALPRLYVLERKSATIANLRAAIAAARLEYPGQPILCAIDYAQLLASASKEREIRMKVTDAFEQIDDAAREHRFVAIAVSQMGRASATAAVKGEALGADTAGLGAESSAIERFASVTMTIGMRGEPREDASRAVELSIGKGRMSDMGDRVLPMSYWGRSGLWRVAGEAQSASKVREGRDAEKLEQRATAKMNEVIGLVSRSSEPLSRDEIRDAVKGRKNEVLKAIAELISAGDLVEVARRTKPGSRSWKVWTPDRSSDAGVTLVRDMPDGADR